MPNALQIYDPQTGERVNVACLVGPQGPKGDPGSDGGIDVSGASIGQTVQIAAVDENGVPTAWTPADFPNGGGEEVYELIDSLTITEENQAERYNFTNEPDGAPYNFKKLIIRIIQADSPVGIALNWYKWESLAFTNGNQAKYYTVFSLEFLKLGGASMPGTLLCNVYTYTNDGNNDIGSGYIRGRGAPLWPFETWCQSQSIDNVCVLATIASSPIPLGTTIEIYGVRA